MHDDRRVWLVKNIFLRDIDVTECMGILLISIDKEGHFEGVFFISNVA